MRRIVGHDARGVLGSVLLCIGRREHDAAEVRTFRLAEIELRLLDRRVVAPFQIVGEAEGKAIDRIELGIDALRQLQGLDCGIRLSQPHQDIAAAGEAMGIVGIDRDRAVHLRLRLLVSMVEDMDAAEDDARAHFRSR